MPATMRAAVIRTPGGPEVLKIETLPIPVPKPGQVLIRVKAFGLNRSELFTRLGDSPSVIFPRVLGIEAAGVVEAAPGGEFPVGAVVLTAMGGMGRAFDGGYAEYTLVPAGQVQAVAVDLPWEALGAIPEMLHTAWGALFKSLQLQAGDRLLIRGGTTSVGLAAAAIAVGHGAQVTATTRNPEREALLRRNGAQDVLIDTGKLADEVRARPGGLYDKVLDFIGTTALHDTLRCARPNGIVCMAGMVGQGWSLPDFAPLDAIPNSVCLTTFRTDSGSFADTPIETLARQVTAGELKIQIGRVFTLDEISEAHRCMEANEAGGKIVVLP